MSDVVNLNRARKAKSRADKQAKAEENRVRFGRTKAERARDEDAAAKWAAHVDGHKRTPPDETS